MISDRRLWEDLSFSQPYSSVHGYQRFGDYGSFCSLQRSYLLTPWCRVLLEKLTGLQLVKTFPAFYGTRRFITALTSVRHLSLPWASPIQSIYPHPTSWRSILMLFTHLRLGLPSGLFPSGFPKKTLYTPLSSPIPPHAQPISLACRGLPSQNIKLTILVDIKVAANRRDSTAISPTLLFCRQSSHSVAGVRRKPSQTPGTEQIIYHKTYRSTARVSRGRYIVSGTSSVCICILIIPLNTNSDY